MIDWENDSLFHSGQQFKVRNDVWMFRLYPRGDTGDKGDPDFVGVFVELVSRAPEDMDKDIKVVLR